MKTMTLNISEEEMNAIEKLANDKGITKTALIRQALRLYQTFENRLDDGWKTIVVDTDGNEIQLIVVL